jgi:hypothetical protein
MRIAAMLAAALAVVSTSAFADQTYNSYDAFYAVQPGAVFGEPLKRETGVVYSRPDEDGTHTDLRATFAGKPIGIQVASDHIAINGKTYRFARAATLSNEAAGSIYPGSANVYVSARSGNRPAILCVEGQGSGSGEADRYKQIYVLVDPLSRKPAFLHLPALLSSCRAVVATKNGQFAFPKNSYLLDEAQDARIGLLLSYFTFEGGHFLPTDHEVRLRFAGPENPFKFSRQDELAPKRP